MKELIIMYLPVILTFAGTLFNVVKTIKGLNLVDPLPHIKSLESRLGAKYDLLLEKLEVQEKTNEILANKLLEADKKAAETDAYIKKLEEELNNKFDRQADLLTAIVRQDVELRADIRRIDNDSEAVQE